MAAAWLLPFSCNNRCRNACMDWIDIVNASIMLKEKNIKGKFNSLKQMFNLSFILP